MFVVYTSRLAKTEFTVSEVSVYGLLGCKNHVSGHAKAMFGQCKGHVWTVSISGLMKTPKFSRLTSLSLRDMFIGCSNFKTMFYTNPRPWLGHVRAMFG